MSSPPSDPAIVTTSNTLPKTEPPVVDADAPPPPPPTTGRGRGAPLDLASVVDSASSAIASVLPTFVSSSDPPPDTTDVPTAAAPAQTAPPRPDEDPKISALRAMFPDFDVAILQTVLDSVHGNHDQAIDVLLGMNDPSYISTAQSHNPETDLDEELARRLMLEDEDARAFAAEQRLQANGGAAFAAHPQPGWNPQSQARSPGQDSDTLLRARLESGPGKDTVAELQEQFTKIAESGKKTFGALFAKVKEKIAEFETQQTAGYEKYNKDPSHPLYRAPEPTAAPAAPVQSQPGKTLQPSSYFEAGPSGTTHQGNTPQIPVGSPGYGPSNPQAATTPALSTITASPPGSRPASIAPDPAKIGMLPKQSISLVRDDQPRKPAEDDDDSGFM